MERWLNRVAVVTGAGSGIGEAITRLLAKNSLRVVAVDLQLERVQAVAKDIKNGKVHAIQGDVTKEEDVKRVIKWARDNLGGVDVLVNNAGLYLRSMTTEPDVAAMNKMLGVNVIGLSILAGEFIKDMRDRKAEDGHIFNLCSVFGQEIPEHAPGIYFYSSTKHVVRVLSEGMRRELRDLEAKIKVTSLSPGVVRTRLLAAVANNNQTLMDQFYEQHAHLNPEDIANALLYSLSTPPHVQVHEITIRAMGEGHIGMKK